MDKIPTAEEFFRKEAFDIEYAFSDNEYKWMAKKAIEIAKLHVKAALEAVLNKAEYSSINPMKKIIDKKSILNAYPDKLIQ